MEEKKKRGSAPFLSAFTAFAAVLLILRIIIVSSFVESGTGFYTGGKTLIYTFNILCVLFVIVFFGLAIMKTKNVKANIRPNGKAMSVFSLITGLAFMYAGVSSLFAFFKSEAYKHFSSLFGSHYYNASEMASEIAQGYMLVMMFIFGVLSAVFFFKIQQECLGKGNCTKNLLLSFCPVWWGVFKAIYILLIPIDLKRVSDLLYEIIALAFLILFFSAFARISVNREEKSTFSRMIAYAMCAALFCGVSAVSTVTELAKDDSIVKSAYITYSGYSQSWASDFVISVVMALFAAALVFHTVRKISSVGDCPNVEAETETNAEEAVIEADYETAEADENDKTDE